MKLGQGSQMLAMGLSHHALMSAVYVFDLATLFIAEKVLFVVADDCRKLLVETIFHATRGVA